MILIVDSGSTKTDWCFVSHKHTTHTIHTKGINPVVQSQEEVRQTIEVDMEVEARQKAINLNDVDQIHYYGAGCVADKTHIIGQMLRNVFHKNAAITIESDIMAACHALCGNKEGLVCILGTGSNSCLYDGQKMTLRTPPLGFILGDEGSGAALGKLIVNAVFKGLLSQQLCNSFKEETQLELSDIINNVYRQPAPNRFLASLSQFAARHIDNPDIEQLVIMNFEQFINKNLRQYISSGATPVINAIGSIAHYYSIQLHKAAEINGYTVGKILKSPINGLLEYYKMTL